MQKLHYERILVKLSGEQLAGDGEMGVNVTVARWIAAEIKKITSVGAEVVVMVGGGNFVRGAQVAGNGIARVTADHMGMLGTMINGIALADIFNAADLPASVLSSVKADQIIDQYTSRRAVHHLKKGRVVIIAGGTGRPYLTTDTAAVNLALELDCDVVCKTTKVDGVYEKDPAKFPDAQRLASLTFQQALENPEIKVMDKAAIGLAMECHKPVVICDLATEDNLRRLVQGETIGTLIQ